VKEALKQVSLLVERFERNIEAYRSPAYNETQLRREFIDPFFEALGWDVANKAGYAEQYTVNGKGSLSPNYVLGSLNSRLLFWRLRSTSNIFRAGWITCTKQYVETLPIGLLNLSDPIDNPRHDRMVKLVEQMLSLHKQLTGVTAPDEKTRTQHQIDATDCQIDQSVYELYGLTDEERKIVQ
jgi:hypothetical protein